MIISVPRRLSRSVPRSVAIDLLALGVLWITMAWLINPKGDFPLNDDWSYGRAVYSLVMNGDFRLTGFTAMPLIPQLLWGALFSLFRGFSFTTLRESTLVLGLIGVVSTYGLLLEVRADRLVALLAALLVALTPLYVVLSFSFMTDVPFLAVALLAILLLVRGARLKNWKLLLFGWILTIAGLLIRQLAILIPASFAVAYLLTQPVTKRNFLAAITPLAAAVCILVGYQMFLHLTIGVPALYNRGFDPIFETSNGFAQITIHFLDRLFIAFLYLGLFLLPFVLLVSVPPSVNLTNKHTVFSGLVLISLTVVVTGLLVWTNRLMPLSGNVLFDIGLGPPLLRDVYLLGRSNFSTASRSFWIAVTILSVIGGLLLAYQLVHTVYDTLKKTRKSERLSFSFPMIFMLTIFGLYLVSIGITGYMDRYLLFALPLLMAALAPEGFRFSRPALGAAGILILSYGLFSVAATHDYLSWNRARWDALNHLVSVENISIDDIDGGFEFNGWHLYDPEYRELPGKSFWWVRNDEYVLTFGSLPGYTPVKRYSYVRWLPYGTGDIFVQRRNEK